MIRVGLRPGGAVSGFKPYQTQKNQTWGSSYPWQTIYSSIPKVCERGQKHSCSLLNQSRVVPGPSILTRMTPVQTLVVVQFCWAPGVLLQHVWSRGCWRWHRRVGQDPGHVVSACWQPCREAGPQRLPIQVRRCYSFTWNEQLHILNPGHLLAAADFGELSWMT